MSKHTPGPWLRDTNSGYRCDVRSEQGRAICAVWVQNQPSGTIDKIRAHHDRAMVTNNANAHLIAKAPEMLALLQKLRDEVEGDDELFYDHTTFTCRYGLRSVMEKITLLVEQLEKELS